MNAELTDRALPELSQPAKVDSLAPLLVGITAVLIWAGTPVATRFAVDTIDPVAVGLLRTALAGIVAVPIVLALKLPPPRTLHERRLLAGSASVHLIFPVLFSIGVKHTTVAHAALALAVLPLFTGVIAALFERRLPAGRWWIGVAIALAGEVALVGSSLGFDEPGVTLLGDAIVFGSCIVCAFGYVVGGRLTRTYGTIAATLWGAVLAGAAALPAVAVFGTGGLAEAAFPSLVALLYLAGAGSLLGYLAWYWALAHGGIGRIGVIQFIQPVLTLVLAVLIVGETITLPLAGATVLILVGVAAAGWRHSRPRSTRYHSTARAQATTADPRS